MKLLEQSTRGYALRKNDYYYITSKYNSSCIIKFQSKSKHYKDTILGCRITLRNNIVRYCGYDQIDHSSSWTISFRLADAKERQMIDFCLKYKWSGLKRKEK